MDRVLVRLKGEAAVPGRDVINPWDHSALAAQTVALPFSISGCERLTLSDVIRSPQRAETGSHRGSIAIKNVASEMNHVDMQWREVHHFRK